MKFRVIQSNDRGLISRVGDKTFYSRKPKKGEEKKELATLFIWVKKPYRFAARVWTCWTGEKYEEDYIYQVTKFKNIIDISGMNHFHQWSNQYLREKLWTMEGNEIKIVNHNCPNINEIWEGNRKKNSRYIEMRTKLISGQYSQLSNMEKNNIRKLYLKRDQLNLNAGFIKYNVDHIKPLSKGGLHKLDNLRIITAYENQVKGSKIMS
mgnify:CR=1 FL=1